MVQCRHHWILSEPKAAVIAGRCKHCGWERLFPSRLEDTDRSNDYLDLTRGGAPVAAWAERIAS